MENVVVKRTKSRGPDAEQRKRDMKKVQAIRNNLGSHGLDGRVAKRDAQLIAKAVLSMGSSNVSGQGSSPSQSVERVAAMAIARARAIRKYGRRAIRRGTRGY